jgi:hypothetical protein
MQDPRAAASERHPESKNIPTVADSQIACEHERHPQNRVTAVPTQFPHLEESGDDQVN